MQVRRLAIDMLGPGGPDVIEGDVLWSLHGAATYRVLQARLGRKRRRFLLDVERIERASVTSDDYIHLIQWNARRR